MTTFKLTFETTGNHPVKLSERYVTDAMMPDDTASAFAQGRKRAKAQDATLVSVEELA